jgi:TonB-dependent receptor-like protein
MGRMRGMRGGPGGPPGGRRPEWMARRGVAVFGNRRPPNQSGIRGHAFFSLNNSALDARPYSISGQQVAKPSYSQVRFGIGAGGALRIPKLISGSRTFFFVNYSGTRGRNAFDRISTVPTAAERAGDFSQSVARGPVVVFDPLTKQPFPSNRIPSWMFDQAASGLLSYIPPPNLSSRVQNYQFVTSIPQSSDNVSLRLNHSLTGKDQLSGSFNLQRRQSETAQLFGFRDETDGRGVSASIGWTHNLTTTLINDLRFQFSRNRSEALPYFAYGADVAGELGIQGTSRDPINNGPPNLSFTNFGALTDGSPLLLRNQSSGFTEGVTLVRGDHTFRFGFEYRRNQLNTRTDENGRGSYSFSGLITSAFDASGNPLPNTGFDMADFLLGHPQSSTIRWGNSDTYFRAGNYNFHLVDDWHARSNLTLNIGMRYEYSEPFYEKYNRMANLDIAPGYAGVALVTPTVTSVYSGVFPRGLIEPDRNNLSPRVGVAWKPWPKQSLIVRAGYGVYYNGSVYNTIASLLGQQPPFANTNTFTTSIKNPLTIAEGFLGVPDTKITNTYAVDRSYLVGYAQTWNLSVERSLPFALTMEIGYFGTKGTRLDVQRVPNQAAPGSPLDSENRRPIPYAVGFTLDSADGNSIYHAGQVRLMRRFRKGISFFTVYRWSKSIDDVSTYGNGGTVVAQNPFDLSAERGLSSFDQRHSLDASFILTSPFGGGPAAVHLEGLSRRLLEDWTLSGGVTLHSGTPFTAQVRGNRSDNGGTGVVGSGRADASGVPVDAGSGFFDREAFTVPPSGRYGDAGRNTIPGPNLFSLNLAFGRSFPLWSDRRSAEFRVEASNALNSVSFTGIGTTVNASDYGRPTAAASMRKVTAQLRLRF